MARPKPYFPKTDVLFWPQKRVCRWSHLPTGVPLSDRTCSSTPRRLPTCPTISLDAPKVVALDNKRRQDAVHALTDLLRSYLDKECNASATEGVA